MKSIPYLINALLLFGLYLPSSFNGHISNSVFIVGIFIIFVIYTAMFLHSRIHLLSLLISLSIIAIIIIFTYNSHFTVNSYGALIYYVLICLLICLENPFRDYVKLAKCFQFVNSINILLCTLIILGFNPVKNFIISLYSSYYPDLVPMMMRSNKPILTFGTHSLGAFMVFVFSYLCLQDYKITNAKWSLFAAAIYVYILVSIRSTTSVIFSTVSFFYLGHTLLQKARRKIANYYYHIVAVLICILLIASISLVNYTKLGHNGFLSRFSWNGDLREVIEYISIHPLSPIGLGYSPNFDTVDSGVLEYFLRGSLLLPLLIYGGIFIFMLRHLSMKQAYTVFIFLIAFEIGFSSLQNIRTLFLLPYVVFYLNSLENQRIKEKML